MKKLLIGLLVLSSSLSYAQDFRAITIKNLTYPSEQMVIKCLDAACTSAMIDDARIFSLSTVNETIQNRRGYKQKNKLYSLTDASAKNVAKNSREAYYGKAVGNSFVTGGAFIVDTVIAVPQLVIQALTPKLDSIKDKKAAKRIKANLFGDFDEIVLKEKYYREIKEYLNSSAISDKVVLNGPVFEGPVFRCQLAIHGCYLNGGRYGVLVEANDEQEAISKCEKIADEKRELFCQLTPVQ